VNVATLIMLPVRRVVGLAVLGWLCGVAGGSMAQSANPPSAKAPPPASSSSSDMSTWLARLQEAPRKRVYAGTYVVSSSSGALSSARIWHVCDGAQQMGRVESLTGPPRSTFRRNDEVLTFHANDKRAVAEKLEAPALFPNRVIPGEQALAGHYVLQPLAGERIAGHEADGVQLTPKDPWRFGYRIWSEKKTGLLVKLQTLDAAGQVLEQAAFSEIQFDAPVQMEQLAQMMANTGGYRVEKADVVHTTAAAEGWAVRSTVPGFQQTNCLKRPAPASSTKSMVQWVFTDGLASISLFIEPFDPRRHQGERMVTMGATHLMMHRWPDRVGGDWWLTVVGEAPMHTLKAFAQGLERRP